MELLLQVPVPALVSLAIFGMLVLIITDTGAGTPIIYPLVRPFMRPYRPSPHYSRIKSKYVI